jgi:hypothetical protein
MYKCVSNYTVYLSEACSHGSHLMIQYQVNSEGLAVQVDSRYTYSARMSQKLQQDMQIKTVFQYSCTLCNCTERFMLFESQIL